MIETKAGKLIAVALLGRVYWNRLLPSIVKNALVETQCGFGVPAGYHRHKLCQQEKGAILKTPHYIYEFSQNVGSHQAS